MPRWIFTPVAEPDEPRWLDGPVWSRLVVCAPNAGAARYAASEWEADMMRHDADSDVAGGTAMDYQSALADPTLYAVTQLPGADEAAPDGVVEVGPPLRPTPLWERVRSSGMATGP